MLDAERSARMAAQRQLREHVLRDLKHVLRAKVKGDACLHVGIATDTRQNRLGKVAQPLAMAWRIGGPGSILLNNGPFLGTPPRLDDTQQMRREHHHFLRFSSGKSVRY
jgi:hypothetical protein